ncbi:MAG TPA: DNA repair protein RecN [Chromatiales bacterium]|nr:DNA repair protein RecN [Chromatiales bacterium]HEX22197.1 DNA repair protein RecN [Chromatiales bacterium]
MLSHLTIKDFAIVSKLDLDIRSGLTVLTGETGAGKSILIDALSLVLGQRAESGVVRHGCKRTEISAQFDLDKNQDAAQWLQQHDMFDDGECIIRRIIDIDKPTKGFINGQPVPMQLLRELGDALVDIHGQHEHQSLLRRDTQRQILDDYAGLGENVKAMRGHYQEWQQLQARLHTLKQQSSDRTQRIELLNFQVQELEALGLTVEEIPQLEEEHKRLANGAELLESIQLISNTLYDSDESSIAQQLAHATSKLEELSKFDNKMESIAVVLGDAAIQIDEAAALLHQYLDGLDLDPQRLQWLEERISAMHDLSRKHQVSAEELPTILGHLQTELNDMEDFDTNMEKLEGAIADEQKTYTQLAQQVSRKRRAAAKTLSDNITEQMQQLGMPGGSFEINLKTLPPEQAGATGLEHIEYLVTANKGQPPGPLNKVASGGELSRISLALQVVTAQVGRIPTLIFDEVDSGIGGRVAEIVGNQLRTLGDTRQVMCITHLAQVAAQGHQHLHVRKVSDKDSTVSTLQTLSTEERVNELARMLGGVEITQQTLNHAEEMLNRATA